LEAEQMKRIRALLQIREFGRSEEKMESSERKERCSPLAEVLSTYEKISLVYLKANLYLTMTPI
jgi:hypothetical protein